MGKSRMVEKESEITSLTSVKTGETPTQPRLILPDLDIKYNGINGQKWITLVQRSLKAIYLGNHLTEDPPSEDAPKLERVIWESEEAFITNWMIKNMESDQADDYLLIDCVRDLWQEIQRSCAETHSDYRVYDLREQEKALKQGSLSISSYSAKLKAIRRELDLLWPTGDKNSPSYLRETKFRTLTFLMGLNSEYENLRSQLLHRERFPTLVEAISELQGAERRKKLNSKDGVTPTPVSMAHLAKKGEPRSNVNTTATSSTNSQHQKSTPQEGTSSELTCGYCRKPGHLKRDCRKLAWKEEQIRKGTWNPGQHKKAYVASEGEEPSTARKGEDGGEIQKLIQSEVKKILQKFSSTSLVQSRNRTEDFIC
ncbi:uncharacterized protein LOC144711607 [Wolffia australiana]